MVILATSKNIKFEVQLASGIDFPVDFTSVRSPILCVSDKIKIRKFIPQSMRAWSLPQKLKNIQFEASITSGIDFPVNFTSV